MSSVAQQEQISTQVVHTAPMQLARTQYKRARSYRQAIALARNQKTDLRTRELIAWVATAQGEGSSWEKDTLDRMADGFKSMQTNMSIWPLLAPRIFELALLDRSLEYAFSCDPPSYMT